MREPVLLSQLGGQLHADRGVLPAELQFVAELGVSSDSYLGVAGVDVEH